MLRLRDMDPVVANQSFFSKYKFTLIAIFVILLAAVPLLLLSNTAKPKSTSQPTTATISPAVNVTPQNADAVLSQTDTDIQSTLNQLDTDLQASQVDTSQDSIAGL